MIIMPTPKDLCLNTLSEASQKKKGLQKVIYNHPENNFELNKNDSRG